MAIKITGWEAAQVLTLDGFLKWCEGKPLAEEDFKQDKSEGRRRIT